MVPPARDDYDIQTMPRGLIHDVVVVCTPGFVETDGVERSCAEKGLIATGRVGRVEHHHVKLLGRSVLQIHVDIRLGETSQFPGRVCQPEERRAVLVLQIMTVGSDAQPPVRIPRSGCLNACGGQHGYRHGADDDEA